jgi:hypothetical protein
MDEFNYALSTVDNPFDPFEEFTSWLLFDNEKGYNSSGLLMRIAKIEDGFTQKEIDEEIERAIDQIVINDFTNLYIKVKRPLKSVEEDVTNT